MTTQKKYQNCKQFKGICYMKLDVQECQSVMNTRQKIYTSRYQV